MSGSALKTRARDLVIDPKSRYVFLQKLIIAGFFDSPVSSEQIVLAIREEFGKRLETAYVQTYMQKFMSAGIIRAIKLEGQTRNFWVLASVTREKALQKIGSGKMIRGVREELFSEKLLHGLRKNFSQDLDELQNNFGANGNATAFLLRKILEKLIIIVFTRNKKGHLLEDKSRPGGWVGLGKMIEVSTKEKLHGIPFLTSKTSAEIKGIKFLGDTAAHNPLVDIDMRTIIPQMPFVITAYEELAKRL